MRNLSKDYKSQRPLLINPSQAEAYLERAAAVELPMGAKLSDMGEMLAAIFGAKATLEKYPPFAVVPVHGVIGRNISDLEAMCGCCDVQAVEEMIEECERDPSIKTIILDFDSPGGTSVGVPELANRIKACSKEVISFTGSECCSAAYWIASQASQFYATPSSSVGSIGVYIAYPDLSKAYEMEGVRMDVIRAGTYKGAGIPGTSLDANQRKMLQDEVLSIHEDFKAAVKSVRSFVEDSSMEGQTFSGKKAAEAGLVTSLVNGFDELMSSLNAAVAAQMEADEENAARAGSGAVDDLDGRSDNDGEDEEEEGMRRMASSRALGSLSSLIKKHLSPRAEDAPSSPGDGVEPQPQADEENEDEDSGEDPTAPQTKCVISDFDGTIRDHSTGKLNTAVAGHLRRMSAEGKVVHVVTGRLESARSETEDYLKANDVPFAGLRMKADAAEPTPAYKVAAVRAIEAEAGLVKHIVENDPDCSRAYSDAGYSCIHPDSLSAAEAESDAASRPLDTDPKPSRA
jgi:signal peptide peptidase SppA